MAPGRLRIQFAQIGPGCSGCGGLAAPNRPSSFFIALGHHERAPQLWGLLCHRARDFSETLITADRHSNKDSFKTTGARRGMCIRWGETRLFELSLSLLERRHFYRSEVQ
jgi:hypothetical protein